jgi:hypothetical protein
MNKPNKWNKARVSKAFLLLPGLLMVIASGCHTLKTGALLSRDWNPRAEGDKVLERLVKVTAEQVKGAHDAEFVIVKDRAYIVAEVNDQKGGESASWPHIYSALSVVNIKTSTIEKIIPFARSEQVFENEALPPGACFVPRILQKDEKTLRCYFASEQPGVRQSQIWYVDFDLRTQSFARTIHRVKLKTDAGIFDMQPRYFYTDAAKSGFRDKEVDFGLYLFDSFKEFDGKVYIAINNFPGGQNALGVWNSDFDMIEIIGHYNEPRNENVRLTESAVNCLPDDTWMAICRNEAGSRNYLFTTSKDGKIWETATFRDFVANGGSSKPTFECFKGVYYLGWQESTRINGVNRSVFNINVSRDGKTWERKYRFETEKSFQYPTFHWYKGHIWLTVTQGDSDSSRKERIMFGMLE